MPIASVTAGSLIDPTTFGNAVVDSINRVGAFAKRTTSLSLPATTLTYVTMPTEVEDTHGLFSPGNALFTIPTGKAGVYTTSFVMVFDASLAGGYGRLTPSGAPAEAYNFAISGGTVAGSITIAMAAGDTINWSVFNTEGVTRNCVRAMATIYRVAI